MNIKVKQLTSVLLSMVLLCLFNACSEEQEMEIATGGLQISLAEDWVDVTSSRATPAQLYKPLQEQFHLKVTKQDTKNVVHDGAFRSYFRTLTPGEYTLEATYGENKVLDWDAPYYAGSVTANVENGGSTQATIPVSVKNALMSVEFTNPEIFGQIYSQYGLEVKVPTSGGSQSLTIWSDITEKSAYLRAGLENVEVAFVGTTIEGNKKIKYSLTETLVEAETLPLQAADHAKITLTAANTGINVTKIEVENVTVEETVPLEWLPIPKFKTATGFSDKTMTFVETERKEAKINYALASPLQDAKIVFNFDAPQYPELTALNGSYVLTTITNEQRTALQNMGITLPFVGSTNCQVDLTGVTERMQTNNGTSTTNTVTINVKANNRWSNGDKVQGTGDVFTMTVNAPTFTVNAQPEHMWSREFTVDEAVIATGNAETIKSNLTYKFSLDDETWYDCSDNRRHKFPDLEHPANKKYKVRAFYRNVVPSSNSADVILETPTQLPNSGMEEWNYTVIEGGWFGTDIPTYYPWNSGANSFWDTNNDYTTRYRTWGSVAPYNCFPTVSYTSNGHSGRAAEIRNTAAGSGNTNAGAASIIYDNNKVPGMLFLGVLNADQGTISEKGTAFTSRPSGISFWYTYSPMNSDICEVTICWMDNEGNTIAERTKQISGAQSSYQQETVSIPIDDEKLYKKASKLFVQFRSSIYSGSNLPWAKDVSVYAEGYDKTFKTWAGSVLRIDDISLIYDK